MFILFSKGDQLKAKLANLKFSKIGDGPWFLSRGLVIWGKGLFVYPLWDHEPVHHIFQGEFETTYQHGSSMEIQ